ncbi:MAG: hypothetical protein OEX04_11710 [Acidimicrobiia bacterium]|nr:hypothetical protein [Acidimicrobiia bacterium]MDH4308134.1 hypothetical protein [Acidimicrobiia bacterium]MDH5293585.1 hypothetical protein [Acidimicrobiia bacterium]
MTRHSILTVCSHRDLLLHHVAPIGLAAVRPTALLVDLDDAAPMYPGRMTIADLLADGVRQSDLVPRRPGTAVLGRGDAGLGDAIEMVSTLSRGWPAIVVRCGIESLPYPRIEVVPAFPAEWGSALDNIVVQRTVGGKPPAKLSLPPLRPAQVRSMLDGKVSRRWRWVRAWGPAWEMPWD